MRKMLKKMLKNPELVLASFFIIVTTTLVMVNVMLRYFFRTGLYWTEEVATTCFVWSVFIGSAAAYRNRAHVGVDIIVDLFSAVPRKIIRIIVDLILLFITGYITYISVIYISLSYRKPTPVLGISSAYTSSSILISFTLMTIYGVYFLIKDIRTPAKGGQE
ncbi:MAG: TRAP transporter small permease [Spirochaetales bacterium]|nr:TRAP transporter small permease [Spirochaetales bacterium]